MPHRAITLAAAAAIAAAAQSPAQTAGVTNAQALLPLFEHLDGGGRMALSQATDSNGNQWSNGNDWRRWAYEPWLDAYQTAGVAGYSVTSLQAGGLPLSYRASTSIGFGGGTRISIDAELLEADLRQTFQSGLDTRDFPPQDGATRIGWLHTGRGIDQNTNFALNGPSGTWGWTSWDVGPQVMSLLRNRPAIADDMRARTTYFGFDEALLSQPASARPVVSQGTQKAPRITTSFPAPQLVHLDFPLSLLPYNSGNFRVYTSDPFDAANSQGPVFGLYFSLFPADTATDQSGIIIAPALGIRGGQSWFHHAIALSDRYWTAPYNASTQSWPVALTQLNPSYRQGPSVETLALWLSHLKAAAGQSGYVVIRWSGSGNGRGDNNNRRLPGGPQGPADSPEVQVFNLIQCVDALQRAWQHPVCNGEPSKLVHIVALSPNSGDGNQDPASSGFPEDLVLLHQGYWQFLGDPSSPYFRPNLITQWVSHDVTRAEFIANAWRKNTTDNSHFSELGFQQLANKELAELRAAAWANAAAPSDTVDFLDLLSALPAFESQRPSTDIAPRLGLDQATGADDLDQFLLLFQSP